MNDVQEPRRGEAELPAFSEKELAEKEENFCGLLRLTRSEYLAAVGDERPRRGLMALYDLFQAKLKIFKETPKYYPQLEWGLKYHFLGTARAAYKVGKQMGYPAARVSELCIAAFFHDIAKITYGNDFFIRKLSRPDPRILNHSTESFQLLIQYCGYFNPAILFGVLQHHEYYDGNGYPLGLEGVQIHEFARVISVTDAYCAMMESREFSSKKESVKDVLQEIEAGKGTQFDPQMVEAFLATDPGKLPKK